MAHNSIKDNLNELNKTYEEKSVKELLKWAIDTFKNKLILANSLSLEDQIISDILIKLNPKIDIFFLDTGRIHQKTYDLLERSMDRYNIKYKILFPDTEKIENFERNQGPNPFYKSIELRKECCLIRKVEPLKRALNGYDAWITGLRCQQSITRTDIRIIEWDDNFGLVKINPLRDWTIEQVWDYIKKNDVPYNKLYDENFSSIGCVPCTRAIKPGENIRAGRWWWEDMQDRECGLHHKKEDK